LLQGKGQTGGYSFSLCHAVVAAWLFALLQWAGNKLCKILLLGVANTQDGRVQVRGARSGIDRGRINCGLVWLARRLEVGCDYYLLYGLLSYNEPAEPMSTNGQLLLPLAYYSITVTRIIVAVAYSWTDLRVSTMDVPVSSL
jgi:hypothetical protein